MKLSQPVSKLWTGHECSTADGRTDRRTDGRTDTQKFGGYNIIPRHFLWRGIKKMTQQEDGIWTRCHEPATPVLVRRYHAPPTSAWLLLRAMLPLGFKSSTIVQEREMLWKIPKILALRMAVRSSFLSQFEVP